MDNHFNLQMEDTEIEMTHKPSQHGQWSRKRSEFEEAAIYILRRSSHPLSMNELIQEMISQNLVTVRGKTPKNSLYAIILRKNRKRIERGEEPLFDKVKVGNEIKFTLHKNEANQHSVKTIP